MQRVGNVFVLGLGLTMAISVSAHHSSSMYDLGTEVTLDGTVVRYEWANPHVYLYIRAEDGTARPEVWAVEHFPTTAMTRLGWTRDTFSEGDAVTVRVNPARDRSRRMARVLVVKRGGITLFDMRDPTATLDQNASPERPTNGLSGTWAVMYEQAVVGELANPSSWPLTEQGIEALESYDEETMNPQVHCESRTAPSIMVFPGIQEIEIGETLIWLRSEYDAVERTVRMDVNSHDGANYTAQGHSIGRWEGNVLVVETARFAENRVGNGDGLPSGTQKHLVERFELNQGGLSLTYRFELTDPEYLLETIRGEVQWAYRPDVAFAQVECDLANARRFLGEE